MSLHSANGSSDSHRPSIMDQQHLIKLRVELFQFERTTIEVHLESYLEKIQRQHPTFVPEPFKMLQHHEMLSFVLLGEISHAPAFSYQTINVQLVQETNPSRVFFTATLMDQEMQFPNATYTLYHDTPGRSSTVLKMDSKDGFLSTPPLGLMAQNQTVVSQFSVSILLENLSFSTTPFQNYTPVEIKRGFLYFPQKPNHHQGQNPVQQTHVYNHMPMFPNPPPTLDPPRLVRTDLNTSVPWNSSQQSFVNQDRYRDRADLVRQVRSRLAKTDTNVEAPASNKENVSAHQSLNVSQNAHQSLNVSQNAHQSPNVSQTSNVQQQSGPVIGDLNIAQQNQTGSGLQQSSQQSSDHHQEKSTTKEMQQQLNPLMRMGFLNVNPPDHTAVANGPPATQVFYGDVPSNDQGAVGGTNVVQQTRRDDNNPFLTFEIPSYTGNRSHQNLRMNNPSLHLYRNPDQEMQMQWDHFDLNSDVSTYPLARTGRYNQYVPFPLAQSDPKYPKLPSVQSSPYGSIPDKVSAIDQANTVTPPSQIGNTQAKARPVDKPVTPPVQTGSLGPTPPPAVIQPTTGESLTTPALKMIQPATNVPIPVPISTGATQKTVSVLLPPPISDNNRVTRAFIDKPRIHQELVNAGKNLMRSKTKKRDKNSRSASED